jgi:hypothetical protein
MQHEILTEWAMPLTQQSIVPAALHAARPPGIRSGATAVKNK